MRQAIFTTYPVWVTCGRRPGKNFFTLLHWLGAVTYPARWCGAVRLAAGLNAVVHARPPLGVAGLQGSDRNGKFIFGALGIFALKLKLHRTWCGWRPRFQRHDCR